MFSSPRWLMTAALAVIPTAMSVHPLEGQVAPGSRIRVRFDSTPQQTLVGTLDSIGSTSLSVRTDALTAVTIPREAIRTLEVSTGRHSKGSTGAAVGGVTGVIAGSIAGFMAEQECTPGWESLCEVGDAAQVLGRAVLGGLVGAGVGWLIGAQFHDDGWRPVSVPRVEVTPVSSRGIGIRVSLPF